MIRGRLWKNLLLAVAATIAAASFFHSPLSARIPVEAQRRDDDCGAAALVILMRLAGVEISEETLLSGIHLSLSHDPRVEGLTALDLRRMVENSGTRTFLAAQFRSANELALTVEQQPVIVLIYEFGDPTNEGTPALGHFVVLEGWSPARGFLVIDPALGRRGFMSLAELTHQAHQRRVGEDARILVMYLERDGAPAAHAEPITPSEERRVPELRQLRRLGSSLPAGKTLLNMTVRHTRSNLTTGGSDPLGFAVTSTSATFLVQHGIDNRTTLGAAIGFGRSGAALRLPGAPSFSLGHQSLSTPLQITLSHRVNLGLPENFATEVNAGLVLENVIRPVGASAGISSQIGLGRYSIVGTLAASFFRGEGETFVDLNPSIGISRRIGRTLEVGILLSSNIPLGYADPQAELMASVGRPLGHDWFAEAFVSHTLFSSPGFRSTQAGLSLTYAIPNRLRRGRRTSSTPIH